MLSVEDLARNLHHEHDMTKEEALAHARKAIAGARKDRAGLEKYEAGKNDNPATLTSANLGLLAAAAYCPNC